MVLEQLDMFRVVLLAMVCIGAALVSLVLVARRSNARLQPNVAPPDQDLISLQFADNKCIGGSALGKRIFDAATGGSGEIGGFVELLGDLYLGADDAMQDVRNAARTFPSRDNSSELSIEATRHGVTMEIVPTGAALGENIAIGVCLAALSRQSNLARASSEIITFPMWREDKDGRLIWANAAYKALERSIEIAGRAPKQTGTIFLEGSALTAERKNARRVRLPLPGRAGSKWFELNTAASGDTTWVIALPADRLVRAETSLQDFVQTLTQTFAHLNVGLAIFSNQRELAIFNPALVDLLGLTPEFLARRPNVFELFDALRENRTLPEPRDYKAWRGRIADLEAAAKDRSYSETWSLVNGRTYRVTGRPHSEGALAFLFEDISSEITLERRFRADLQTTRSVFNGLNEAIAVFNAAGELIMSNAAYKAFCGYGEDREQDMSFVDASRRWQDLAFPTPIWGDARDFACRLEERSNWSGDVRLRDGRTLACRFETLVGGSTLVGFKIGENAPIATAKRAQGSVPA